MANSQPALPETVTINGQHYALAGLSEKARAQLDNLRFVESQLYLLNNRKVLTEAARTVYGNALADMLPEKKAPANRKNGIILVDGERYLSDDFSEEAKVQLFSLQFADAELLRLRNEEAVAGTAKARYLALLAQELEGVEPLRQQ